MGSPSGLVDIPLADVSRVSGGRTAALNIGDDAGDFRHTGVAKGFLLQGEARARGGGHYLVAGEGRPDDGGHGGLQAVVCPG